MKPFQFIGVWQALLAAAAVSFFVGCQTGGSAQKREIRTTLEACRVALNSRSFDQMEPLLSDAIRVDGMTDELSRAGLRGGMFWPTAQIDDMQILKISGGAGAVEARVVYYMPRGFLLLRVGFDSQWRIRTMDADPVWKSRGSVVKAPFRSPFVATSGLMFVRGLVNGRTGYLLLDTGSSNLLLNSKYFSPEKGGGMPGIMSTVLGLQGQSQRAFVRELKWGNLVARDIRGQLHGFSQMEVPGITPLLGALGFEQFRNSVLAFDWPNRTVEVSPPGKAAGHPAPRATVPFFYYLHAPMMDVRIGEKAWPMLLDTGSQVNLLPRLDGLGAHFRKLGAGTKISDGGRVGTGSSPLGIVDEVAIGGIRYRDMLFAIFEVPYLGGNGILGSQILQSGRVEIDYPGKMISIW